MEAGGERELRGSASDHKDIEISDIVNTYMFLNENLSLRFLGKPQKKKKNH